jgi:phospholipid-binding lipoprotein MlaA
MSHVQTQSVLASIRRLVVVLAALALTACGSVGSIKETTGKTISTIGTKTSETLGVIGTKTTETLEVISNKTNIGNNPADPLEGFNRQMFAFNDTVDEYVLKPVATAYQKVTPSFVQTGVGNFFGNIGDVWTAVNNLLQGRVNDGVNDVGRVLINTTFGVAGLFDVGSATGLPKHNEDFGQTLGRWGVKSGPYLVLPILGPSTVRDAFALPVDFTGDPWSYTKPNSLRYSGTVLRVVDKRATFLDAGSLIEEAALDKYVFFRDAYLQRRAGQVNVAEPESAAKDPVEPVKADSAK